MASLLMRIWASGSIGGSGEAVGVGWLTEREIVDTVAVVAVDVSQT